MPKKMKQRSGLTLSETVVSAAIIAIMIAVVVPASRVLQESLHSSGARTMISSALSAARALAAKHQRYAGLRFQYDPNGNNQYMIFILHDPVKLTAYGFRAIEGLKPMRLPENLGVMESIGSDGDITDDKLIDKTTFSIIFTPAGKLVIHEVRVGNKDGIIDNNTNSGKTSGDDVFNKRDVVDDGKAKFYQDDYYGQSWSPYPSLDLGLGPELSRSNFIIYNKKEFSRVDEDSRWTDCLQNLDALYINPYTGSIIE